MEWEERKFKEIMSSDLLYYDEQNKDVCTRICKVLSIDIFTSFADDKYFKHIKDHWSEFTIKEIQTIEPDSSIFEYIKILEKIYEAESNILFIKEGKELIGIVHFTDYARQIVYHSTERENCRIETRREVANQQDEAAAISVN